MPSDRIAQFYFHGKKRLMHLILLPVIFTSCTHYYYAPNTSNIPMLREKGEGRINLNFYATDEITGGEFQGSFATGKQTAVMLNIATASAHGGFFNTTAYLGRQEPSGAGSYAELGYGIFSPVPQSKWVFETYAGLGVGSITNWYTETEKSKVRFVKIFVQPSLGWCAKNFELGISSRFALVNMKVRENTGNYNQEVEYLRGHRLALLAEPALLVRFGIKHVKISMNYTHSGNLSNNWQQETGALAMGLSIPFNIEK